MKSKKKTKTKTKLIKCSNESGVLVIQSNQQNRN